MANFARLDMQQLQSDYRGAFAASLAFALAVLVAATAAADTLRYFARIDSPGGDISFGLVLEFDGKTLKKAEISNGSERIAISDFEFDGFHLILRFPHYNSEIVARAIDDRKALLGSWAKRSGRKETVMPFHANTAAPPAESEDHVRTRHVPKDFAGRWKVKFESSDDPAVAIFDVNDDSVEGTILTTTGDFRYLAGQVHSGRLRLSTFDGTHAFLFEATPDADGTLTGNFWSGDAWHETWTAKRDDAAELPDGFEQVHLLGQPEWSKLELFDVEGNSHSLGEENSFGALTIINVFGSWCPNCHDEAPFLVELEKRYGRKGLKIIGLAFEASGEFETDVVQVNRYVQRHSVHYPVFFAGISDKQMATEKIGFIDRLKAFPTSIFVDRAGKVIAIYSGFSGPATGEAHEELKQRFEQIIQRQLDLDSK
jgi:thiol-disulfide isomerase/thioredoxin